MSENIAPDVINVAPDVLETAAPVAAEKVEVFVNYSEKSLGELVSAFRELEADVDRMKRSKEAEAIKSAFYKRLIKERTEENPLAAEENEFKELYDAYKKERAVFNKEQEKVRMENLEAKKAVLEDLKALVEKQDDLSSAFPAFREIQSRWREIGPVPATHFRDLNDSYQFFVEKFYDMVKINQDLRDLDFKKNLEAKEAFCEAAEKLAAQENVIEAFRDLQKLHEQWKEYGPVAKEYRESIWERFRAATAVINKKYQAHFEGLKETQAGNLEAKSKLCEQVEAIAAKAEGEIKSSNEWNALTKEIEDIQKVWKTIGFASKKENQKIYDRFRAACDRFFEKKRDFYAQYKDVMTVNLEKKMALIEQAEALKSSTEWKKATDQFINLQRQWKEIGAVPRKKSDQLWKRFRAACDAFFAERDKNAKPENDFYANLKAKKKLIEEIRAFTPSGDTAADEAAARDFSAKWREIGFVPFKEKEAVTQSFKEAFQEKFPSFQDRAPRGAARAPRSEKDILIQKYNTLQQDIVTYENNMGFFSMSKNAEQLLKQMQAKIENAKKELKDLEIQIRNLEKEQASEQE